MCVCERERESYREEVRDKIKSESERQRSVIKKE